MGNFPTKPVQYLPFLTIALLCVIGFSLSINMQDTLVFSRNGLASNQWWRLLSAHFLHTNFVHFIVNLAGLGILWMLHGEYYTHKIMLTLALVLALSISVCIWLFSTNIAVYVGVSGMLHGLFAWGVMHDIFTKRRSGYVLLAGLIFKIIDEQFFSNNQFMADLIEASVAIDAHLYGAVAGTLLAMLIKKAQR